MSNSKTFTNAALYSLGEIIPRILSFLLLPLLTRYLSPEDYGITGYITTTVTFLYVFTILSVNTYALRNYYKYETELERKTLVGNIFVFLTTWGFVMLCVEVLLLPVIISAFQIQVPFYPYFLLGLLINYFDVVSVVPLIAYRVHQDAKRFVMLGVGRTILQYLLMVLFVVHLNLGLYGAYLGRLLGCIPFVILYFYIIRIKGIFTINTQQIRDALIFSLPLLPGALSYLVISIFDRIVLERYVSLSELGIYSIASTLALTLNIVILGMYRSFEQKIFQTHGQDGYTILIDRLYRIYIALLYIAGFLMIAFSRELLFLLTTSEFYNAENYIVYLTVAVIISGINTFLSTLFIAEQNRKMVTKASIASVIISVAANIILIRYYGIIGACFASMGAFLIACIMYISKSILQHKYVIHQFSFLVIFFAYKFIMPSDLPLNVAIIIKAMLAVFFILYILRVMRLQKMQRSAIQNVFKVIKNRK